MKGWQLGLNGRWRSASIAGYERFPNPLTGTPEGTVDRSRPIKGGEFFELGALLGYQRKLGDRIRLHLQLNIENLFDEQTPILRSVGTDSLGVFGPQYAIVPLRWELHRPRNYRFSATFEF